MSFWAKLGLGFTHVQLFMPKHFKHKAHMRFMFSLSSGENQNVINVYNNKLSNIRVKNKIHHRLKSSWGIRQTLNQHFKLKMTKGSLDRRLRAILFRNQYLMIT
jgi:hypothetical protein